MDLYSKLENLKEKLELVPDDADFSLEASRLLEEFHLESEVCEKEIYELAFKSNLPKQEYGLGGFGVFNVTVFNGPKFNIQAYVMNSYPTEIHDHHFTGAFKVLHGKSLHTVFDFIPDKEIEEGLELGKLERTESKIVQLNDVVRIKHGYIHQLVRIKTQNITLLVAKRHENGNAYYLYPNAKISNFSLTQDFVRKIDALRMLSRVEGENYLGQLQSFLDKLSVKELLHISTRLSGPSFRINADKDKDFERTLIENATKRLEKYGLQNAGNDNSKFLVDFTKKARALG